MSTPSSFATATCRRVLLACAVSLASLAAHAAAEISPGLWELSLETRTDSAPGFQPPAFVIQQCIRAQDAANPGDILAKMSTQGASGCNYTNRSWSGNTFRFAMSCSGSYAINASGDVTVSDANNISGQFQATANVGGNQQGPTLFRNILKGRRVAGC